ncbi:ABC transporter permease [Pasteurella skyensis]|uniref:ABC transporter permease n=1 Tax=Phocoenobacter skyensis TaxID=97481 RepID=A0AAJ6NAU4_9PAST|nr:ABC transporter permease [Pasteurella skyensis]MDP8161547.1 ABC transporter permease [Pasteurella skyensis]MDP8173381.1 ABC transporter permease [Pasteurella skyensis]MDP8175941.1 ABC transporter permease [Pasteurella skyensis]MDP8177909.1 ABC transporter permease [Pasteurella skyensis]MDP8182432.1 ABC transporter permease [Pasteurella skyensis]
MNSLLKNTSLLMLCFLGATIILFGIIAPQTLSAGAMSSIAIQLPQLGILTLAMFIPVISGGLNLAITYIANIGGLLAAALLTKVFSDAGWGTGLFALVCALAVGALIGALIGLMVAWFNAHPILVTLGAMILLKGSMEWVTRGGGISGMPECIQIIGNGTLFGIPIVFLIFLLTCAFVWFVMHYTRLGFSIYMIGSNPNAAEFSGIAVKRTFTYMYALSGALAALAGFVMLAQNNSMRIDAGKDYLLITLLACFLSGADPFGGFGKVTPLIIALLSLQLISSGMNILGANQFLTTALWGIFLIVVMVIRFMANRNKTK